MMGVFKRVSPVILVAFLHNHPASGCTGIVPGGFLGLGHGTQPILRASSGERSPNLKHLGTISLKVLDSFDLPTTPTVAIHSGQFTWVHRSSLFISAHPCGMNYISIC